MRRMNRFSSREGGESTILTGTVVSQQPGTNVVDVRVARSGNRVIRNVIIPHGAQFYQGDLVLICTTPTLMGWVALTRIQDLDSYGLDSSGIQREDELHPPSNLVVSAVGRLIVAQWDTWAGAPLCFLVEHKADPRTDDTASTLYTRGSYCIYEASGMNVSRYFRVSSLRLDVQANEAYYSGWTVWAGATTDLTIQAVYNLLVGFQEEMELRWDRHLIGDI